MFGVGGILGTGLALIALEVFVTASQNSASGASSVLSLLQVPGRLAASWMDPSTPLIPDKSGGATSPATVGAGIGAAVQQSAANLGASTVKSAG